MKKLLSLLLLAGNFYASLGQTQITSSAMQWHMSMDNNNHEDWSYSVIATDKKTYIGCGYTLDKTSDKYFPAIFKLNNLGQIVWTKIVTMGDLNVGTFYQVTKASDGYIAVGRKNGEAIVAEFDDDGNFLNNSPTLLQPINEVTSIGGTITECRAFSVALDPNYNSINHIVVGGKITLTSSGIDNQYAFVTKINNVSGSLVDDISYYGGNNYGAASGSGGNGEYGDNNITKLLTKSTGASSYTIYGCGYISASSNDNVVQSLNNADATSVSVTTFDKDMWLVCLQNDLNPTTTGAFATQYNKTNILVDVSGTYTSINTVNSSTYPYSQVGPLTARNNGNVSTNPITYIGAGGATKTSPATVPLNAGHNMNEKAYDMIFAADGNIALVGLVNYIDGNNGGNLVDNSAGTVVPVYTEFIDGDAFLLKLDPSDGSLISAKNVAHMGGTDFSPQIRQDRNGNYIIAGSTADKFGSSNYNLPDAIDFEQNGLVIYTNDASTMDIWERSYAASPAEDCFCAFGLDTTADGGFVVSGNNDENGDDWSVTKFACPYAPSQMSGFYQYVSSGVTQPDSAYTIASSTTWSSNRIVASKIIVPSGVTLTIQNCTISFASSDHLWDYFQFPGNGTTGNMMGIDVKVGGHLVISNATLQGLTTTYGSSNQYNMWDGIIVEGNPNKLRSSTNQGTVTVSSSTHIKNARYGIIGAETYRAYVTNNYTDAGAAYAPFTGTNYCSRYVSTGKRGGGIVSVDGSYFDNCRFGMNFQIYNNVARTSAPVVTNTTFDCSADGMGDVCTYTDANGNNVPSACHFAVWGVDGVTLHDNTFTSDASFNPIVQPIGIEVADAMVDVSASASGSYPSYTYGSGNSFSNLNYGIQANYSPGSNSKLLNVLRNTFDNNTNGIAVQGSIGGLAVNSNTIKVAQNSAPNGCIGLNLAGCSEYTVDDNTITRCSSCSSTSQGTGINVNTGYALNATYDNVIQSNGFDNMHSSTTAQQINASPDLKQGLQFHCNTYNTGSYDINRSSYNNVSGTTIPATIRQIQGTSIDYKQASNNVFANSCVSNTYLNNDAVTTENVTYWCNPITNEDPTSCYTSLYSISATSFHPSHADECPDPLVISGGGSYHLDAPINLQNHTYILNLDNTISTTDPADPSYPDLLTERNLAIDKYVLYYNYNSNYDSAAMMLENYKRFGSAFSFYMEEQSWTDARRMLDSMKLNNGDDSLYKFLGGKALTLDSAANNWLGLDSTTKDSLGHIVQSNHMSGYMAGAISGIIGTGSVAWPIPVYGSGNKQTPFSNGSVSGGSLSVYPNPNSGTFNVDAAASGMLYIYNIEGMEVMGYKLVEGKNTLRLPGGISAGIYLGKYVADDSKVKGAVLRLIYQP
jgi:hypothetical protein